MSELYELPDGWEWKKLDELTEVNIGKTPTRSKKEFFLGDKVWLSIRDLKGFSVSTSNEMITNEAIKSSNIKIIKKGTLLMSFKLTLGRTAFADCDLYTNEAIASLPIKDKNILDKYFLNYSIGVIDLEKEVDNAVKGKTLNKQKIKNLDIPLPPLQEQKRIVSKLDTLFEKIDRSIALHQKNMDEADVFMGSVLNDVFGELEEKYEKKQLKDIVDNYDGKRVPIKASERETANGIYPYYGASGIIDYVNDYIFDGEYLLVSEDGANLTVRKYPIAFIAKGKFWVNNHAHIISAKKGITTNKYLEFIFAFTDIGAYITGSAQPKLSQRKMNIIEFVIPPLNIQQKTATYLDEISKKIEKIKSVQKEKMESLVALKASILDQAFRGEL